MSRATATDHAQKSAAQGFIDTCTITRVTGSSTNPQTGVVTPTTSTIYTGKCKIQQVVSGGSATPATVAEAQLYQLPLHVHVPMSVTGINVGDKVTITASVLDPDLVGREFWVRDPFHKTFASARRLGIEEVVG